MDANTIKVNFVSLITKIKFMEKRTQKQRSYTYFLMKKVSKLLSEVKPTLDKVYYTLQPNETPIINYKNLLKNGNENI